MNALNLDVILSATLPMPAPYLDDPPKMLPAVLFTGIYNVLDFPAGAIPVDEYTEGDRVI